jgi:hypothetical protein
MSPFQAALAAVGFLVSFIVVFGVVPTILVSGKRQP